MLGDRQRLEHVFLRPLVAVPAPVGGGWKPEVLRVAGNGQPDTVGEIQEVLNELEFAPVLLVQQPDGRLLHRVGVTEERAMAEGRREEIPVGVALPAEPPVPRRLAAPQFVRDAEPLDELRRGATSDFLHGVLDSAGG